jgi:hypothetical protein
MTMAMSLVRNINAKSVTGTLPNTTFRELYPLPHSGDSSLLY